MSDTKLFRMVGDQVETLEKSVVELEKSLQSLLEKHLETFLGVTFLRSEYATGKVHGGRIDTLGLDENNCPVIIEYKRAINENVINQGLFYLNWLLDHQADFKLLVMDVLNREKANQIDWSAPRLICVAGAYTKFDEHAIMQINRNIDLLKYCRYGKDLIALEMVCSNTAKGTPVSMSVDTIGIPKKGTDKSMEQMLMEADENMKELFASLQAFLLALGDGVTERQLKLYFAYSRIRTFASVVIQKKNILLYLKMNPQDIIPQEGFVRDMRNVGHWGVGDIELNIRSLDDIKKAEPLIQKSFAEQ